MAVDEQVEQNALIPVARGKAVIRNLARAPRLGSAAEIYLGNQTQKPPCPVGWKALQSCSSKPSCVVSQCMELMGTWNSVRTASCPWQYWFPSCRLLVA